MRILITGAKGFLGSYLSQHLHYEIVALSRQELDLSDPNAVSLHFQNNKYDAVIHCGAAGRNTPAVQNLDIVNNNLASVINLVANQSSFGKLINIGTGAEFDISLPIEQVSEFEVFNRSPVHSYGLSKNIITRYLHNIPNCYNLRLFGCFDSSEDSARLLKKVHSTVSAGRPFEVMDREFDMISARDFATVIDAVLNGTITDHDINCVYAEKTRLSDILSVYCNMNNLNAGLIKVIGQGLSYSGSGTTLSKYHLPLLGLNQSLEQYKL